ncbi:gamma-glutamyltransferase family protein [Rhodophyticola sp. CCM32]|uniref:gamma-glutamyltransferase family protein n=1 Tax=Rhodophyticola sp. CCM32 TaxID=2916397 RepID=UPI00107FBDBB|nr:gamma-glutamyltransferase family protein [Rhodophyticola sp. CCM32]QBY01852.1 gamma-glutamyltransferase family protein [Rhodophyticola sp. CCM32]
MRDFHHPGRSPVFAENGMCATSHPLAAKTAINLLEQGGNAVDAAIGAAVLLGFCEPQMTGLGGDMFALVKPGNSDRIIGLNASGRAPAGLSADTLRAAGHDIIPLNHPAAVTVPGAVDGFCRLHSDLGQMPLPDILAPAIHYAEAGVPVAPRVSADWAESDAALTGVARDRFLLKGAVPQPGQIFRAQGQADVLRRIAAEGRAGFYEGEVAADMVDSLQALGGTHTRDDFAATACDSVTPVRTHYKGAELIELPPNGQGSTAILLANMLSGFDIAEMAPWGVERAHLELEATKLAYDARNRFIGDPGHSPRADHLTASDTAKALAALIDPDRAMANPTALSDAVHKETIYITVVDRDRMAVSLIYSIFHSFGSGLASNKFGILFQNRGAGFNLIKGHPNEAGPGKRPMHTIIPGMIRESGGSVMPFGVMGGQYQATGHARFLSNIVDFGMSPQAAIDAPRLFADGGHVNIERGYAPDVRQALEAKGHKLNIPALPIGGAQAIRIDAATGVLQGGSDPRKDGCALGY